MTRALLLLLPVLPLLLPTPALALPRDRDDADAVVLEWERTFTLTDEGRIRRSERRVVKLLSSRAYGRYADPRIDFEQGRETVRILHAVTHLPSGETLPVPEYSRNIAAPNDVAGWPEYAAWQQRIVSFSGLEPGAVVELEYEVVTEPGVVPWLEADLRLGGPDPIENLTVTISVPEGAPLKTLLAGLPPDEVFSSDAGRKVRAWRFRDIKASPDEPRSPPWRARCGRLAFTTCPDAETFAGKILDSIGLPLPLPLPALEKVAKEAAGDEADPAAQVAAIAELLKESYNPQGSPKTWRDLRCQPALEVLRSNYGNPLETATLCASLLGSLGLGARPVLAMDARADAYSGEVPLTAALAAVLVRVELPDRVVLAHPTEGVIENPGAHGPWLVLGKDGDELGAEEVQPRGWNLRSEVLVTGKLVLDAKGRLAGRLKLAFTGAFFDPKPLESEAGRKAFLDRTVGGLISGLHVNGLTVQELSSGAFRANVEVEAKEPVLRFEDRLVFALGDGPLFLERFPLPLDNPARLAPVDLGGRLRERVDLVIELPEGFSAAPPRRPLEARGDWGVVSESGSAAGRVVRLDRMIEFTERTLPVAVFAGVRAVLNDLRAPASRHLVVSRRAR